MQSIRKYYVDKIANWWIIQTKESNLQDVNKQLTIYKSLLALRKNYNERSRLRNNKLPCIN